MTTSIKPLYVATSAIAIPAAMNALANGACVACALIDNSSDLLFDVGIEFSIVLAAGVLGSDQQIRFYAAGGAGGGVYSNNFSGAAGLVTLETVNDFAMLGYRDVGTVGAGGTVTGFIPSLAAYFNGTVPKKWALLIENRTGVAFAGSGHSLAYGGQQVQGLG